MTEEITIKVKTTDEEVLNLFSQLSQEMKDRILGQYVFEDILMEAEKQLQGKTEFWAWDTSGWRFGAELRNHIAKMNGIEEELRKDFEDKIRSLESDVVHYKKYYNWHFKVYHDERSFNVIKDTIGFNIQ